METIDYQSIAKESVSKADFALKLGYKYHNGRVAGIINQIIKENNLDISHFRKNGGGLNKKYEFIEKICPVCSVKFTTQNGSRDEKFTCGCGCSNKYFASTRRKDEDVSDYTIICFRHHKKECVVCGEKNIVAVHHFDENDENDSPENLIPMCPTHHTYWHSRFKSMVADKVIAYRDKFIEERKQRVA
jgi:hypothetical protein